MVPAKGRLVDFGEGETATLIRVLDAAEGMGLATKHEESMVYVADVLSEVVVEVVERVVASSRLSERYCRWCCHGC
jgi:hypothetical protein